MNLHFTGPAMALLVETIVDALPEQRINQIKRLRMITGLGLKESKDLMDAEHQRRGNPVVAAFDHIVQRRDELRRHEDRLDRGEPCFLVRHF
jgi:DNA-binding transcriptional MerR regulator